MNPVPTNAALPVPHALRVLMVTSEWPTATTPAAAPFIARSVDFLRRNGIVVDVFHFRGNRRPLNYLRAWRDVRTRLRMNSYDLLHAQFGQSGLLALPKSLPLVVTFRGSDIEGIVGPDGRYTLDGWLMRQASRQVARVADEVIVVASRMTRRLPARPVHVIPSGLDLERFCPAPRASARAQLKLPADVPLVLFAGNTANPRKRFALAQAAVSRASTPSRRVELVTADKIDHTAIALYMNACDVLLLTSLHEGSPNVVKEALACNLPVVSTDVGDVRERVGGIEGCAVVDATPDELAAALRRILDNPRRIAGRQTVLHLDEQALTLQLIAVYRQALARRITAGSARHS